ncbi:hypothetical protein BDV98DRAFT_570371 [Pterulicium gracile]|uniref:Uncharacterized protein n=1 Tax=Pterulicium gracile TaxID=1884261 RepID=A0A5C3QHD2_9AGAR|nr:hypothetical protein BDV98DRAFT_570371 [Pterula gracilis]
MRHALRLQDQSCMARCTRIPYLQDEARSPSHPSAWYRTSVWVATAGEVIVMLESLQVDWNTVVPLAYANRGEADLICPFVNFIGVKPRSLAYEAAVAAVRLIDEILETVGFPMIQVAFIELTYRRRQSSWD